MAGLRIHCLSKAVLSLLTFSTCLYVLIIYILQEKPIPFSTVTNYFLEQGDIPKQGYIIDTPACNILNFSAWDTAILPFVTAKSRNVDCSKELRQWTYTRGTNLILNTTSLERSGFSASSVSCCYMKISRVEQSLDEYDFYADRLISFSKECKEFTKIINPISEEFIRVICTAKYWPFSKDILYRQFHALAQPSRSPQVESKLKFWNNQSQSQAGSPPNVILIGIDSMSRLSFHRNMGATKRVLEEMGAVEMFGYTKVGENTFPNAVPLLSGYLEPDLKKICLPTWVTPQDSCPFVFKRFSAANYLTAFVEDVPGLSAFHYEKLGFIEQPADFYFRPFILAVHRHTPTPWWTLDCIGYRTVDQVLLHYISDLLALSKEKRTPLFLYSWMTNLAHEDINSAQHGDGTYANFLKGVNLENTILVFMSDHGYRYGSIRQTFPGWYEEKLPNLWIRLPPALKTRFPSWEQNLKVNSRRLTSTFDLYRTISHVLDVFTSIPELPLGKGQDGIEIERKFGQSLFEFEVPLQRQCKDAGISVNLCACATPNKLSLNDTNVIKAAAAALSHINAFLPEQCAKLSLSKIAAGAVIKVNGTNSTYIIAFLTVPGEFLFEANVNYFQHHESGNSLEDFSISTDILRMSKMTTDVSCVHDSYLEKLCFCRSTG